MAPTSWTTASGVPLGVALGLAALALGAAALLYRPVLASPDHEPRVKRLLLALRLVAVALVALVFADPILRVESAPRDAQRVSILVDTSRSMALRDSIGGASRVETAARLLGPGGLVTDLGRVAKVEVQGFDATIHAFDLGHPVASGDASDLAGAVARAAGKKDATLLAAIVLLTDGCETSPKSLGDAAPGVPVYPVALGSLEEALAYVPDIALTDVRCPRTALVRSTVEAKVELRAAHLDGEHATVEIRRGETVLAETSVALGPSPVAATLRFALDEPGLFELEARVVPHERERFTENNARRFPLEVGAQKLRVLYYEGTPRWEYKFLARELKKDAHVALEALLRTSGDRAYEQATAGARATELFPATREALRAYDCVVLGDVDGRALAPDQAKALRAFVSEDSGGLVVLAGKDSFGPEGLAALGLEPLLPVALEGVRVLEGTFDVAASPEALGHPALAGIARFLPLESVFALGPVRPGAQLLASARGPSGAIPLALAQRYGSGRVFLFASDADWKWVMKDEARGGRELFVRLWGQAIRWAASRDGEAREAASQVALASDRPVYRAGEPVTLRLRGSSATEATVGDERVPLAKGADALEGTFVPGHAGLHHARAGEASCDFYVEPAPGELDRIAVNEMLLDKVASATGGQCFDATRASQIPGVLRASGKLGLETREVALGESWPVFAALVLVLAVEWALRKRMQVT